MNDYPEPSDLDPQWALILIVGLFLLCLWCHWPRIAVVWAMACADVRDAWTLYVAGIEEASADEQHA